MSNTTGHKLDKFESSEFRQALASFATGVTVVTATSSDGQLAGITANSFTSVSLDPPLILWCLASTSDSLQIFKSAPYFAVNILAADQTDISNHFANREEDKFKYIEFTKGIGDTPILNGCTTWLQCRTTDHIEFGDHWIFVGEVEKFNTVAKEALLYHQGTYAMSLPQPETTSKQVITVEDEKYSNQSLYSLLLHAIQTYQEIFDSSQYQVIGSYFEARILAHLKEVGEQDINHLRQKIQVPKAEMQEILENLNSQKLIMFSPDEDRMTKRVKLTSSGDKKAAQLLDIAKKHEEEAYALIGRNDQETFRDNLIKLINWRKL